MEKILLDTDIGGDIDDAVCLAYLLSEPQCELVGITTVCGESEKRAAVADAICRTVGKQIPIVAGMDNTMQPIPVYPTPDGAEALEFWQHSTYEKADAPAFLYQKIKENPHEIILIGIGNMTNIATLLVTYPDAAGLLKGLYMMNGYFDDKPLPEPYYNWNAWADPLASKIVFATNIAVHRTIPLDVTDRLTIESEQAELLFQTDSNLMKAVFSFGNAWLESSDKLTLHDPLAAVCIFHPDICHFERGNVQVETEQKSNMGATTFLPSLSGNAEIAKSVDREQFYRILSNTLRNKYKETRKHAISPVVIDRAKSAGAVGEAWLANLDNMISELEKEWHISVGESLPGGTHAFVAYADAENGEKYILKMDMPENLGGKFLNEITVLKLSAGIGYTKLHRYDLKRKACLLERLGKPINQLGYSVEKQLEIICGTLKKAWEIPVMGIELSSGKELIEWFRDFIGKMWEKLNYPCSKKVIDRAFSCLQSRENSMNPSEFVLIHGDAHGGNTLKILSDDGYKLIDPDGLFYEKAYDLGVLMREWREEYRNNPIQKGKERCIYLSKLTGVDARAIFEWGFLQCVSTGMVFWNINPNIGKELLDIAENWCTFPSCFY